MKVKRQKHSKKVLTFYRNYFGFQPPYHVLVDGTFCKAALKFQVNILEQVPKYFDSEVKLHTTKCVMKECEALGPLLFGPLKVLQQYDRLSCKHRPPVLPTRCLRMVATKQQKHKYIVATQDKELSDRIRAIPGIPLLYISHAALTLEAPSDFTQKTINHKLAVQVAPTDKQEENLKALKKAVLGDEEVVPKKKKKKGPKGRNPLSCKKKKKNKQGKDNVENIKSDEQNTKKRKRRRKGKSPMTATDGAVS